MNDEYPLLLEAFDDRLAVGQFVIGLVNPKSIKGEEVTEENVFEQFIGNTSPAYSLIAWGIIRNNAAHGEQSILLHHRDTMIVFPKQYE